jgi:23S rRNA pseudouridine1911/1915/1917 synthase
MEHGDRGGRRVWTVGDDEAGCRLDKFLATPERLGSRRRVAEALQRGKVFVNDVEASPDDASARIHSGAIVSLWIDRPGSARKRRGAFSSGDLRILYEDDVLIVLDKPAGLLSVPLDQRDAAPSLYDLVETHLRPQGKRRPLVVHRIDQGTSGLVVFATDSSAQRELIGQFKRREPQRTYLAVVRGHPRPAAGEWRDYLAWDERAQIQKETDARDPNGVEAVCHYRVIETLADSALVEVRLRTGRQNQIRIQAALRGHPLIGERRYLRGPGEEGPAAFARHALHAYRLEFRHPRDGRMLQFEAPIPADLSALLTRLRRRG